MTRKSYPSDKADQYMVRFPDGLRDRLKDEAAKNNRSMNAEIIARLESSFSNHDDSILTKAANEIIDRVTSELAKRSARD